MMEYAGFNVHFQSWIWRRAASVFEDDTIRRDDKSSLGKARCCFEEGFIPSVRRPVETGQEQLPSMGNR